MFWGSVLQLAGLPPLVVLLGELQDIPEAAWVTQDNPQLVKTGVMRIWELSCRVLQVLWSSALPSLAVQEGSELELVWEAQRTHLTLPPTICFLERGYEGCFSLWIHCNMIWTPKTSPFPGKSTVHDPGIIVMVEGMKIRITFVN